MREVQLNGFMEAGRGGKGKGLCAGGVKSFVIFIVGIIVIYSRQKVVISTLSVIFMALMAT